MPPRRSKTTEAIGQLYQADKKRAYADSLQRESHNPFDAALERLDATKLEAAAEDVLKMPEIARPSTHGGGMALYDYPDPDDLYTGMHLRDTLRNPNMVEAQASLERHKLLLEIGCVDLGQDLASTIEPRNSIERMLAGQLASVHYMALRFLALSQTEANHAAAPGEPYWREHNVEACRLGNVAARLMASFQDGALTLAKLRSGGRQTVVVQHVQVIAGDVTTGGGPSTAGGLPKKEGTTSCTITSSTPGKPRAASRKPATRRRAVAPPSGGNGAAGCMGDTV
jgi:hypothetical protein